MLKGTIEERSLEALHRIENRLAAGGQQGAARGVSPPETAKAPATRDELPASQSPSLAAADEPRSQPVGAA